MAAKKQNRKRREGGQRENKGERSGYIVAAEKNKAEKSRPIGGS